MRLFQGLLSRLLGFKWPEMAQKGEYHNHSKRGMREGLIKRESQQTKNLVFEPVPRFNFFIVHKKDKFGSFFLSKEIEPD